MPKRLPIRLLSVLALASSPVAAGETLPGPVEAEVLRVIDGDTFVAEARIWPEQRIKVSVRIRGVDAPEVRTRCAREKAAGKRSRRALEAMIGDTTVQIRNISGDKFYGRVVADVTTQDERAVSQVLLARALARPYSGGKRVSYC